MPRDTAIWTDAGLCVVNEGPCSGCWGRRPDWESTTTRSAGTIVGVVKDYHYESLSKRIQPEQHVLARSYVNDFLFKVRPGQLQPVIAALKSEWKSISDNYPFEYTFLDESIAQMYDADMRWRKGTRARLSCVAFAILIACMGLFGLSAINAAANRDQGDRHPQGVGGRVR